jgi:hypothetical protein
MAEYPAKKYEERKGIGRTALDEMSNQYCAMEFTREQPA